ncbi:exosortase F system-associated protein [Gelidibacter salicanalis]|uniref:Exosortase F system-associated protein n=1 Tax=Gelidibacter salicanalis TaxID=291193 RepID=A0A5C7AKX4_9FLAO|nr:exosortase F system-associated protein [Gelidibacter salicanalis]TXE09386.1 exosortase F system-associated protein [Gelidibacter salicanalis]
MIKVVNLMLLLLLFGMLILIRAFEHDLFYDPYLTFFENDYLYIDNPRREVLKLTLFTTLRFLLNSLISLGILFVFFDDRSVVKFSALIYTAAFIVLLVLYLYFVINPNKEDYYIFFNIRRFLIQPLLLLLLLPAFYYNQLKSEKS